MNWLDVKAGNQLLMRILIAGLRTMHADRIMQDPYLSRIELLQRKKTGYKKYSTMHENKIQMEKSKIMAEFQHFTRKARYASNLIDSRSTSAKMNELFSCQRSSLFPSVSENFFCTKIN